MSIAALQSSHRRCLNNGQDSKMNSVVTQSSSNQSALVLSSFSMAARIGDSTLRGMLKLSQLNAWALVRSVEEHGSVAGEVQESDPSRAVALHGLSVVADGTKMVAYTAHVADIYLATISEIAGEYGNFCAAAIRQAMGVSQHLWLTIEDRAESLAPNERPVSDTFERVAREA
jgi:hypothetical protein